MPWAEGFRLDPVGVAFEAFQHQLLDVHDEREVMRKGQGGTDISIVESLLAGKNTTLPRYCNTVHTTAKYCTVPNLVLRRRVWSPLAGDR